MEKKRLPRKGWSFEYVGNLHIHHNGKLVYAIENREKDGEIWLLNNEPSGYCVCGYFHELEPEQQEAIVNHFYQRRGLM